MITTTQSTQNENERILAVKQYVHAHLTDPLDRETLAQVAQQLVRIQSLDELVLPESAE